MHRSRKTSTPGTSAAFRMKMTEKQFARKWSTCTFEASNEKGLDYMTVFENSRQLFSLKLDDQGKITRLNFATISVMIADKTYLVATNNPLKDSVDLLIEERVRPYIQSKST